MSHLDKLKISKRIIPAAKPRRRLETVEYRRAKLIANIEEQIELAQMALEEKPLELERKRGHRVVQVRPRLWWTEDSDGRIFAQVRYNKVPLNLAGRGTSIEVGTLKKLPATYRTVVKAVEAGELDQAIGTAAAKSRP